MIETPATPLLVTTNPRTIITEVGQWAERQPWGELHGKAKHAPDYGVGEELGEALHCVLKRMQGIRGFDSYDLYEEKITDAIGDAMVYLSHWCYLKGAYYTLTPQDKLELPTSLRDILSQLYIQMSKLVTLSHGWGIGADEVVCNTVATGIARCFQQMAAYLGFDILTQCLYPTWHKVKSRDWIKNNMTGEVPAPVVIIEGADAAAEHEESADLTSRTSVPE